MKLFGLRIGRLREWFRAMVETESLREALPKMATAATGILFARNDLPLPYTARRRLRTCLRCPLHSTRLPKLRGSKCLRCLACGCYLPYLVSAMPHKSACHIKAKYPSSTLGWDQ
jgi:hypothetical protein